MTPAPRGHRSVRRAVALLLALIAVTVSGTLASSFLTRQGTGAGIAQNVRDHAAARCTAETGLDLVIESLQAMNGWRDAFEHGAWSPTEPFGRGVFSLRVEDGEDRDGDGTIGPDEGDMELNDDPQDPATVTVIGRVNQATHLTRAVGNPEILFFGHSSPFADGVSDVARRQIATQVSLQTEGALVSISLYAKGPPPKKYRLAIYGDADGEPGVLLAQTDAVAITSNTAAWRRLAVTPPVELEAGVYWLAFSLEHVNMAYYASPAGGQTRIKNHSAIHTGFDSVWGPSHEADTQRINIEASYMTGRLTFDLRY